MRAQEMPYRLTRNLATFVTPFGLEGVFLIAQVATAQALLQPHRSLKWTLALFFRCAVPCAPATAVQAT